MAALSGNGITTLCLKLPNISHSNLQHNRILKDIHTAFNLHYIYISLFLVLTRSELKLLKNLCRCSRSSNLQNVNIMDINLVCNMNILIQWKKTRKGTSHSHLIFFQCTNFDLFILSCFYWRDAWLDALSCRMTPASKVTSQWRPTGSARLFLRFRSGDSRFCLTCSFVR